jgi:ubiquinone/menaquinone biosynthesis C-methylase UbiE
MQAKLQRRVQRYGWDLAATDYEMLWQAQLAVAQDALLLAAKLTAGERVLDVACGTGVVTLAAAEAVGANGQVVGVDLSEQMIRQATQKAAQRQLSTTRFIRMDAEAMAFPDADFDVVLCALGLMYMPEPEMVVSDMRRLLRPGGRVVAAVWGERSRCGWSALFPIVDAEVSSEVCPLFFRLGQNDVLTPLFANRGFAHITQQRIASTLRYDSADQACDAAFIGGPVALAWSRFDAETRSRVRRRYTDAIECWRQGSTYLIPGEFVIVAAEAE